MEEQNNEGIPEKEPSSPPPDAIPEPLFDSNHSLHSHASNDADGGHGPSNYSPSAKTMQISSSLSGISSGIGSHGNTQSSLSDDGSFRSSNGSPDVDSGYKEPIDPDRGIGDQSEIADSKREEHPQLPTTELQETTDSEAFEVCKASSHLTGEKPLRQDTVRIEGSRLSIPGTARVRNMST